jgi:hypothetical protein
VRGRRCDPGWWIDTLVIAGPDLARKDVMSGVEFPQKTTWQKRRKVLGDITNQAALPGHIRPSATYGGCEACNTTLCASGSCFRKYHDYIAMKK